MLLYVIATVLIALIGTFIVGLTPTLDQTSPLTQSSGQLMVACHEAAVYYAEENLSVGSAGPQQVTTTNSGTPPTPSNCLNPTALLLNVYVSPGTSVGLSTTPIASRVVTTYLNPGQTFGNTYFQDIERQVYQLEGSDPSLGIASTASGTPYLSNYVVTGLTNAVPPQPILQASPTAQELPSNIGINNGALVIQTIISP